MKQAASVSPSWPSPGHRDRKLGHGSGERLVMDGDCRPFCVEEIEWHI